jgi:hypothetical protein
MNQVCPLPSVHKKPKQQTNPLHIPIQKLTPNRKKPKKQAMRLVQNSTNKTYSKAQIIQQFYFESNVV